MPALKTDTVTYDARGNITSRSDVGTYSYGTANAACGSVGGAIAMAGPHAVAAIAGLKNAGYCYDANGNTIRGDGRTITYTGGDMVASVQRGSNIVSFDYGPDRKRFRRVDVTGGTSSTTLYVAGGAMEVITRATRTDTRHYIGDFAVVTTSASQGTSQTTTQYLHRDHLGSVDTITNASGATIQRMSFDAWGKRRETNWLTMSDGAIAAFDTSATTNRGFTGHEMIDPVGLVHMNGRVYDPEIGRFLSADPHVQEVDNHQNWNRYSYVLNNPLSYTDSTGYFFKKLFGKSGSSGSFWKKLGNLLKVALKAIVQLAACYFGGPAGCAAAAGAMTLASGGSLSQALKAAAFAFISAGIFKFVGPTLNAFAAANGVMGEVIKAGIHGVIQGALNVAQGGSFIQGFASGALGSLGGYFADSVATDTFTHTAISAAFGCAGAAITGGKCAEGAVSAAMANLFNRLAATAFGVAGGYAGASAGGALTAFCAWLTGGACAAAAPLFVAGGAAAGRTLGGAIGGWIDDIFVNVDRLPDDRIIGAPSKPGNAPIGDDGHPVEIHHKDQTNNGNYQEMTRKDHRGGDNFQKNHNNTGQEPSLVDRAVFDKWKRTYWRNEWNSGRFDRFLKKP